MVGYGAPTGNARTLLEATLRATDLVVAAPTYWYGLPAAAKLYLDHWSGWLRVPDVGFKAHMAGRALWTITVNADEPGDGESSDPLVQNAGAHGALPVDALRGALVGHGNRPGQVEQDEAAMAAAPRFLAGG